MTAQSHRVQRLAEPAENEVMLVVVMLLLGLASLSAHPLTLGPQDVRIEQNHEGGYDLYVRAADGMGSVLLTESTVDPEGREANYALRNPVWHPVNGDERRKLDGEFLNAQERGRYFLISSTVREIPGMGAAFHLFIPYVVEYGYPWTRAGDMFVGDNSWINIRAFALPYADYEGAFRDNPFVIRVMQPTPEAPPEAPPDPPDEPAPDEPGAEVPPEVRHLPFASEAFAAIASETDGRLVEIHEADELVETIRSLLETAPEAGLDLALVIDTTGSMLASIEHVQRELVPMLLAEFAADAAGNGPLRVGVVLFRDYFDEYLVKHLEFQEDLTIVQRYVDGARAAGGGDIPEAVHEGLFTALVQLSWEQEHRVAIVIGDAPPHPRPRGRITESMVFHEAERLGVTVHTILLPHP